MDTTPNAVIPPKPANPEKPKPRNGKGMRPALSTNEAKYKANLAGIKGFSWSKR